MTQQDWASAHTMSHEDFAGFDGHFVYLRWNASTVECFCDVLGLRTVYWVEDERGLHVSNKLDWIAKLTKKSTLQLEDVGSRWLLQNQIGFGSCVHGVHRLGPGGSFRAEGANIIESTVVRPWLPRRVSSDPQDALLAVNDTVHALESVSTKVGIGLSGGLDSRMLLAIRRAECKGEELYSYTVGESSDPDVYLASAMARSEKLNHTQVDITLPDPSAGAQWLRDFASQTLLSESIATCHKLCFFERLPKPIDSTIDGGFAEVARRKFLQRLSRFGEAAIHNKDYVKVSSFLRMNRAPLFQPEVLRVMESGIVKSVAEEVERMPALKDIGIENFADLFAIRTRFPNYEPPEQARHDAAIRNLMPMVQPSFLNHVFSMDLSWRRSARWFYQTIRKTTPSAAKLPLEKSGHTYSFGAGSLHTFLSIRLKKKFMSGYSDPWPDRLLHSNKEAILDTLLSQQTKDSELYRYAELRAMAEGYYAGNQDARDYLAWWISFEWWRQSLIA